MDYHDASSNYMKQFSLSLVMLNDIRSLFSIIEP